MHKGGNPSFLISFLFLLLAGLLSPTVALAGLGISPPSLSADHLVPGARYSQVIYLVRDDPEEDVKIKAELNLNPPSVRGWVSIEPGEEFVFPKGARQFPVKIIVNVPKDISLANYGGQIRFTTVPEETGQVTIAFGAFLDINLKVGDNVYRDFSIALIDNLDVEEGWNPKVRVRFQNNGNVPEAVTGATYELRDQFDSTGLAFSQKGDGFPEIAPFTSKEAVMEFPMNFRLNEGQYRGVVTFFEGSKVLASQKSAFNVLNAGALSGGLGKFLSMLRLKEYGIYYLIGILLLSNVFLIFRRRRKVVV